MNNPQIRPIRDYLLRLLQIDSHSSFKLFQLPSFFPLLLFAFLFFQILSLIFHFNHHYLSHHHLPLHFYFGFFCSFFHHLNFKQTLNHPHLMEMDFIFKNRKVIIIICFSNLVLFFFKELHHLVFLIILPDPLPPHHQNTIKLLFILIFIPSKPFFFLSY